MDDAANAIDVHARERDGRWYGLAFVAERLVATAVASSQEQVLRHLERSLPGDARGRVTESCSAFCERTVAMLCELEAGDERHKTFSLAAELLPEPLPAVLRAAAAIPIGYVTSYGSIGRVSDAEARYVGRVMASNPLYPIVPCHRVVGTDFSLVGYRGRTSGPDLEVKLERLRAEARAWPEERELQLEKGRLLVYPVERVLEKAGPRDASDPRQGKLFE